ncbi:MAG: type VI secretion system ImpA family N-terminal domain-containing protein [Rubrivivax sp.]|nr:type VI secretion system ImpA family N-terminal domain-containing protein [Rubrivivax sp.]
MSDLEDAKSRAASWLAPLDDTEAPCGPDLEYDNDFLALTQSVAGKPESQFGPAEPPEWRKAAEIAEGLLDRSRDLRVAIEWTRSQLHLNGFGALALGLELLNGMVDAHWDHLHPMPDPDDGDAYGRVNAFAVLAAPAGLLGDLRESVVVEDRAVGVLQVRDIEAALGLAPVLPGRTEYGKGQVAQIFGSALERAPEMRAACTEAVDQLRTLMAKVGDKLGSDAPDLKPLFGLVKSVAGLLPDESGAMGDGDTGVDASQAGGGSRGPGLSGRVNTRDEAMRAIDLVIEFLERTEPTNPAPLFLRRARQLVSHNFLQLMKALAPESLAGVARVVGVDPDSVTDPDGGP